MVKSGLVFSLFKVFLGPFFHSPLLGNPPTLCESTMKTHEQQQSVRTGNTNDQTITLRVSRIPQPSNNSPLRIRRFSVESCTESSSRRITSHERSTSQRSNLSEISFDQEREFEDDDYEQEGNENPEHSSELHSFKCYVYLDFFPFAQLTLNRPDGVRADPSDHTVEHSS